MASTVKYLERSILLLVTSASDLPSLFCCLRRNVMLIVINTSSFVSRDQQSPPLTATSDHQLATVRRHRVYYYNTWWSQGWQHAMKRDFCRNSDFSYPACIRRSYWQAAGPRGNIAITFGMEKLEWCGYLTEKFLKIFDIRFDKIHERDRRTEWRTDTARRHRSHLCIASRGKKTAVYAYTSFNGDKAY